jgi:hypothetical protein
VPFPDADVGHTLPRSSAVSGPSFSNQSAPIITTPSRFAPESMMERKPMTEFMMEELVMIQPSAVRDWDMVQKFSLLGGQTPVAGVDGHLRVVKVVGGFHVGEAQDWPRKNSRWSLDPAKNR